MKVKMKVTLTYEYEADSKHYGTDDAQKMAEIDQRSFNDGIDVVFEHLQNCDVTITVEPVGPETV